MRDVDLYADRIDFPPAPALQGDVFVLPWLELTAPAIRAERAAATTQVPATGQPVEDGSLHVVHGDPRPGRPPVRYGWVGKGHTIGTLVVPDGAVAALHHPDYDTVRVGPGVYVLHRQPKPRQTPRPRREGTAP